MVTRKEKAVVRFSFPQQFEGWELETSGAVLGLISTWGWTQGGCCQTPVIGFRRLSSNHCHNLLYCRSAQIAVSLQQATQIILGYNTIITVYIETKIVWIETELLHRWNQNRLNRDGTSSFFNPRRTRLVFTCVLWRYVASTVVLVPEPFGGRWQRRGVTSYGRIWRARLGVWAFGWTKELWKLNLL